MRGGIRTAAGAGSGETRNSSTPPCRCQPAAFRGPRKIHAALARKIPSSNARSMRRRIEAVLDVSVKGRELVGVGKGAGWTAAPQERRQRTVRSQSAQDHRNGGLRVRAKRAEQVGSVVAVYDDQGRAFYRQGLEELAQDPVEVSNGMEVPRTLGCTAHMGCWLDQVKGRVGRKGDEEMDCSSCRLDVGGCVAEEISVGES